MQFIITKVKVKKIALAACVVIFTLFLLTGCISSALSGANLAYTRHDLYSTLSDASISHRANMALDSNPDIKNKCNIVVATLNQVVLLVGQAPTKQLREKAKSIVSKTKDVRYVINDIHIASPISVSAQSNDTWITTKVKTQLITSSQIDGSDVKVVTENGTVYLMGIMRKYDAYVAVQIAKHTSGVKKVVKVFEYITPITKQKSKSISKT